MQTIEKNIESITSPQLSNKPFISGICSIVFFILSYLAINFLSIETSNIAILFSFIFLVIGFSSLLKFKKHNKENYNTPYYRKSKLFLIIATTLISLTAVYFIERIIYFMIYGFGRY